MNRKEIETLIRMAGENSQIDKNWISVEQSLIKGNYVYAAFNLGQMGSLMKASVFCTKLQEAIN